MYSNQVTCSFIINNLPANYHYTVLFVARQTLFSYALDALHKRFILVAGSELDDVYNYLTFHTHTWSLLGNVPSVNFCHVKLRALMFASVSERSEHARTPAVVRRVLSPRTRTSKARSTQARLQLALQAHFAQMSLFRVCVQNCSLVALVSAGRRYGTFAFPSCCLGRHFAASARS